MNSLEIKQEILSRSDIIEIISEHVLLSKRGRNFIGLCPFHSEKTPSFTVSPDKQIYKCFGCGKSGNIITFLMEKNSFSFIETLKFLANKYGIPFTLKEQDKESVSEIEEILSVLEEANKYYQKKLLTKEGKICKEYFSKRDFSEKTIQEFRLGYAPDSFDELSKHLHQEGYSDHIIAESGLSVTNENGRNYDRFRNRAIFPIFDIFGRIIGFGARNLNNDKTQAKYINSPQTKVYDKSKVLYGLFQGKNEIVNRKNALLVEGYADVITLHQHGYKYAVASSGTSLTIEQLKLLSRYTKTITIIYDADTAGINATERALELSLEHGFTPNVVSLPSGDDPDSVLRNNTPSVFQGYLENPLNFLDFLFDKYRHTVEYSNSTGKSEIIKRLMNFINLVPDKVRQDLLIQELASKFDFNDFQIRNLYKLSLSISKESSKRNITEISSQVESQEVNERIEFEKQCKSIIKKLRKPEYVLLNLILSNSSDFENFNKFDFSIDKLITKTAKTIYEFIQRFDSLSKLFLELDSENTDKHLKSVITSLSLIQISPSDNWDKYFTENNKTSLKSKLELILINLELERLEIQISESQTRLKKELTDLERLTTLESINNLSKEKNKIKTELGNF